MPPRGADCNGVSSVAMSRTVLMLLLSLVFVAACGPTRGGGGGGDDDDSAGDDDDDDDDDAAGDDDDAVPDTETDCDDGVDEDADGATDCADDDCAEVAPCFWPDAIDHAGDFDFDGWEIECDVGFPIDVDVDDCQTAYTSLMTESTGCDVCDRTYAGTFAYSVDSCAELIGEDSPSSGSFGFVFHSPTQWEIYA